MNSTHVTILHIDDTWIRVRSVEHTATGKGWCTVDLIKIYIERGSTDTNAMHQHTIGAFLNSYFIYCAHIRLFSLYLF